jgi:glutamate carboxypeptidase
MKTNLNQFRAYFDKHQEEFISLLEDFAARDTPTGDAGLLDDFANYYAALLEPFVDSVELIDTSAGRIVRAVAGQSRPEILVLTHMDTVWPAGAAKKPELKREGNILHGPGVLDMKSSLVSMLFFFRAAKELGIDIDRKITLLATPDEESLSKTNGDFVKAEAVGKDAVIVLEFPMPNGAMKIRRKGIAEFKVVVTGKAAHAGVNPQDGANAIEELALQINEIAALNDLEKGTTVTFSVISGGTGRNVVPDYAEATIDMRSFDALTMEDIAAKIRNRKPYLQGTTVKATGGIDRPPMESSEASLELAKLAQGIAAEIGFDLLTAETGGGSDGNFTAAMGIPTIDGLGIDGLGAHMLNEHIEIDRIVPRQCLISELLLRI